jgi:hypothetical protein
VLRQEYESEVRLTMQPSRKIFVNGM